MKLVGNRTILNISDGCGWGTRSARAAEICSKVVVDYLSKPHVQDAITNTQSCEAELKKVLDQAHQSILEQQGQLQPNGTFSTVDCGNTTAIIGLVMKIRGNSTTDDWAFICTCVGDCKAYHYNSRVSKVTEVTVGNRVNLNDAKDPGGRLGPWNDDGSPDLRNLKNYFWPCGLGDMIILASDGVHDNLDPEHLGFSPAEVCTGKYENVAWSEIPREELELIKSRYACELIEKRIKEHSEITPKRLRRLLIHNAQDVTKKVREYMESNPNTGEPKDYKNFPGKMDHTSCICYDVGDRQILQDQFKKQKKNFWSVKKPGNWKKRDTEKKKRRSYESEVEPFAIKLSELKDNFSEFPMVDVDNKHSTSFIVKGNEKFKYMEDVSVCGFNTWDKQEIDFNSSFGIDIKTNQFSCVLSVGSQCSQKTAETTLVATNSFLQYLNYGQHKLTNSKQVSTFLIKSIEEAHKAILRMYPSPSEPNPESEITMLCGLVCKLPSYNYDNITSPRGHWEFICANVGNNKAFYWSHHRSKLSEITTGNEHFDIHSKAPGGKIGASGENSIPDLHNLRVYTQYCDHEKDIIIVMSSLIYNNFDPEVMGVPAKALIGFEPDADKMNKKKNLPWSKIPVEQRVVLRLKAMEKCLQSVDESPLNFVEELIKSTSNITHDRREYFNQVVEREGEEIDYSRLPGKMGHGMCIAIRVGQQPTFSPPQPSQTNTQKL
uniref:PPM-type phosphatase domain-containing protein n=1 Tax=Arcella intermedia TaxID=1963864 RepID=A0A6B2KYC2_9EUKA